MTRKSKLQSVNLSEGAPLTTAGYRGRAYRGYQQREIATREPLERFLIVCEGKKTEPNYFEGFRVPGDVVKIIGLGDNTDSLVEKAIQIKQKGTYDQHWCVFDRDSFPTNRFNRALLLAQNNGFRVAYSNEAFELWYLLHFHYYDAAMDRAGYAGRLSELLGKPYAKNSRTIYDELRVPVSFSHALQAPVGGCAQAQPL